MPAQGRRRPRLGQSLCLLGLLLIAAVLTSSGLRRPLAAWMPASGDTFATILPARIEPAAHISLITEYSARVAQVLVQPGTAVNAGDLIVSLENAEITTQVAAAEKRVAIAAARLRDVRARENYERSSGVEKERLAAAVRAREAARERLEAFSQEAGSNAAEGARLRVSELAGLVRQGLATSAELESARSSAATADREAV